MSDQDFLAVLQQGYQALNEQRVADAALLLEPLIAAHPDEPNLRRLAVLLRFGQGRTEEAAGALLELGRDAPGDQWVWATLLQYLAEAGQGARAIALCREALAAQPGMSDVVRRVAAAAIRLGDYDTVRRMVAIGPAGDPALRYYLGNLVLRSGDWAGGFELYENRWAAEGAERFQPDWTGAPDPTGILLVYDEQGFGDTLQFLRYLPALKRRFEGRVVLRVQAPLVPLVEEMADQVIVRGQPASVIVKPPGTTSISCTPLMSAPWLLNRLGEWVGVASPPYYRPPKALVERAAALLGPKGRRPRVGLVWKGVSRAIPFATLAPLLDDDRVEWVSLQYGEQPGNPALRDTMGGNGLEQVAGLCAHLDLVVTVDTSTAHLAASQGVPTWIMLDKVCCWRWTDRGETSEWYESVRLFRQEVQGDWPGVVARLQTALAERFS
ncbi:conserved protein of unknown function (Tetratricopeptide-like helical,7-163) [Magnetospirillum sp. XM-1]|uniref:tetratricopeptide repeat protein n=1 Tax=Magnetospirillum sp. XM-1 TaxID=1663591 RepID=UPI00073DE48D|nr:tetratricopeptide repeat protein [Magnetospirillum sp. XM-1]CUW38645.1 conserved protein of unknown function (Tetratricopeptide-like helical,7-163) [Magnetospirillum sp. XM-1]